MEFTELEKRKTKKLYSQFIKYSISKEDLIILSQNIKVKRKELTFSKQGEYDRDKIIPITSKYGMKLFSRSNFETAIKESPLITNENFQLFIACNEGNKDKDSDSKEEINTTAKKPANKPNKSNPTITTAKRKKSNNIWTYLVVGIIAYFVWPSQCGDTKELVAQRSEKFTCGELSGTWKGQDDLYMHIQHKVILNLNSDGTWNSLILQNDEERREIPKQSGTYYTTVTKSDYDIYTHSVFLEWDSPYGLRVSEYELNFAVNPWGEETKWGATDMTEEGYYLSPISGYINNDIMLRGDIW